MHKRLYFILLGLFLIFSLILFSFGIVNYIGNKFVYIIFSLVFNFSLIFSVKKKTNF